MSALAVPFQAAALLLVYAGWSKLRSPSSTVLLAEGIGLSVPVTLIRALSAGELALGAWALVHDSWVPAALVAVTYAGFAAFVTWGLVSGDLTSCGCFAGDEAEPRPLHVVLDALAALAAAGVALGSAPATLVSAAQTPGGWATVVLALTAAVLGFLALSRLPVPGSVPDRLAHPVSAS